LIRIKELCGIIFSNIICYWIINEKIDHIMIYKIEQNKKSLFSIVLGWSQINFNNKNGLNILKFDLELINIDLRLNEISKDFSLKIKNYKSIKYIASKVYWKKKRNLYCSYIIIRKILLLYNAIYRKFHLIRLLKSNNFHLFILYILRYCRYTPNIVVIINPMFL